MPSGKVGHHPGWKPLQGSAATMSQAGLQARAGSPDPLRGTCKSPSGFHRRDCNEHPLPSASKCVRGRVCRGSRNPGTLDSGYLLLFFRCGRAPENDVRCGACMGGRVLLARGKSQSLPHSYQRTTEHMVLTHTLVFFSSGVESRTAMLHKIWMWRGNFGPSSTMGCM
jgi:hypothetical protein